MNSPGTSPLRAAPRRWFVVVSITVVLVGTLASPVVAGPGAQRVVLHLHGTAPVGELDWSNALAYGRYMAMDRMPPSNLAPSSTALWPPAGNTDCAANPFLPVWVASVSGKLVGDLQLTLHVASTGGKLEIRIWKDLFGGKCDSSQTETYEYPPPSIQKRVSIPRGQSMTIVKLQNETLDPVETVVMQVTPLEGDAGRVLYDSQNFDSTLSFRCETQHRVGC